MAIERPDRGDGVVLCGRLPVGMVVQVVEEIILGDLSPIDLPVFEPVKESGLVVGVVPSG